MTTKVLNLYAGIGGNRKRWEDVDVTAVEWDTDTSDVYRDHFPDDEVVEADAHEYLKEHYDEYDFIWASPPCPTHSEIRKIASGEGEQNDPVYPDMRLYQEVLFLQGYFAGDWVVENVKPWYDPLIDPSYAGRHAFWSKHYIPDKDVPTQDIEYGKVSEWEASYGFDLSGYDLSENKKTKMLRNCVQPRLGEHVFNAATSDRQTTADEWVEP